MSSRLNFVEIVASIARIPGALRQASLDRKHRKLMRRAPRYDTFGKVVGIVRPAMKRLLEAPLSGRLCVYYEVAINAMRCRHVSRGGRHALVLHGDAPIPVVRER